MLIDGREKHYFPAKAKEIYDVSGAGDTLVALFSICIASGYTNQESAIIANQAAGIVVGKFGTASLTLNELTESFDNNERKIKTTNELVEILDKLRRKNKKIVFTNGCFDILHVGHMKLLNKAKEFGDVLILGLNSDESIQIIKGPDRPINSEYERIEVLSNISPIDYIVLFNESTPKKLISIIKPDIHVKGGDYNPDDINNMPEAEIVKTYGGIVKIVPRYKNMSTSNLLNKIGGK
jgi:D-beta-D-heptose 7-phosphate kinase/D-beta-D-heptose 1-phosphate adenosyltransferase